MTDDPDPAFTLISEPAIRPSQPKPPPPISGWSINVACNNPANGAFACRANLFDLIAPDGDIALNFSVGDGAAVKFAERLHGDPPRLQLRVGGKRRPWFRVLRHQTWSGNWCWNRYWLTDRAVARLLRMLWANFDCDGGWTSLIDRRITAAMLKAALEDAKDA